MSEHDLNKAVRDRSNRFQALMHARAAQYPDESYHDRFMRCSASPEGAAIWAEAKRRNERYIANAKMMAANSYDASQPRDPAGTSTGGQWTSGHADIQASIAESFGDRTNIDPERAADLISGRVEEEFRDWADANIAGDPGSESGEILKGALERIAPYDKPAFRGMEFKSAEEKAAFLATLNDKVFEPRGVVQSASSDSSVARLFAGSGSSHGVVLEIDAPNGGLRNITPICSKVAEITAGESEIAMIGGRKYGVTDSWEEGKITYVAITEL